MCIGFFDSGLGGLFVLRHVVATLPQYHYVFLGDTENVPYGGKSDEEIYTLVTHCLRRLFARDCRLVVFACNTASVTALRKIQNEFLPHEFPDRTVLGVIIPTVEEVVAMPTQTVAVIGTERTIRSGKYEREILARDPKTRVLALATPFLVPLIETGSIKEAKRTLFDFVTSHLLPENPDTLVLGCTHYGMLKEALREAFPRLRVLAQEEIIPEKLRYYLTRHPEIESRLARDQKREFILTKTTPAYESLIRTWFGDFPATKHS